MSNTQKQHHLAAASAVAGRSAAAVAAGRVAACHWAGRKPAVDHSRVQWAPGSRWRRADGADPRPTAAVADWCRTVVPRKTPARWR